MEVDDTLLKAIAVVLNVLLLGVCVVIVATETIDARHSVQFLVMLTAPIVSLVSIARRSP